MGKLADRKWSTPVERAVVGVYSRLYDVDFEECEQRRGYASFDEFFTRNLRPGVRPIDTAPDAIVSPADGRIDSMGTIGDDATYFVKGRPYRVGELLGDEGEARRYLGGSACVVYLSPRDYHRVHAPVDGVVTEIRSLPGDYFPVNSIGMSHIGNLFSINRRVAIAIDTESMGRVTVVMVAAIVVGRITVKAIDAHDVPNGTHRLEPGAPVLRGEEIGVFHLGSTAVVFFEPRVGMRWSVSAGMVKYGERMGNRGAMHRENGAAKVLQ